MSSHVFPYRRARYGLHFNNHSFQQAYRTEPTVASVKHTLKVSRYRARKKGVPGAAEKQKPGPKIQLKDNAEDREKQRKDNLKAAERRAKKRKEKEEKKEEMRKKKEERRKKD